MSRRTSGKDASAVYADSAGFSHITIKMREPSEERTNERANERTNERTHRSYNNQKPRFRVRCQPPRIRRACASSERLRLTRSFTHSLFAQPLEDSRFSLLHLLS